jgi:hypothetical protein
VTHINIIQTPAQYLAAAINEVSNNIHPRPLMDILNDAAQQANGDADAMRKRRHDVFRAGCAQVAAQSWAADDNCRHAEVLAMLTVISALLLFDRTSVVVTSEAPAPNHHKPPSQN